MIEMPDFDEFEQGEDQEAFEQGEDQEAFEQGTGNLSTEQLNKSSSESVPLSAGNGESETSPENVIKEAIEIGRQIHKIDSNRNEKISPFEAYLDLHRDKLDINRDGEIRGEELPLAGERWNNLSPKELDEITAHREKLAELFEHYSEHYSEALSKVSKLNLNAEQIVSLGADMITDGTFEAAEASVLIAIIAEIKDPKEKIGDDFHELVVNGLGKLPCDLEPHQYQRLNYNCGPTTAKMLLERMGTNVSEGAVTVQAILDGYLTEKGMNPQEMVDLLERFGHKAEVVGDINPITLLRKAAEYIDKGHLVAMPVDFDELITDKKGEYIDDDHVDGGYGIDHVVWITKIDFDNQEVHVHDSGKWYGKGNIHPLDVFIDATTDPHGTRQLEFQNLIEGVSLSVGPVPIYSIVVTKEPAPPLECEVPLSEMDQAQQRANLQPH